MHGCYLSKCIILFSSFFFFGLSPSLCSRGGVSLRTRSRRCREEKASAANQQFTVGMTELIKLRLTAA